MLILLIALAIVMILRVTQIKEIKEDVSRFAPRLEEEGVEKIIMGHRQASDVISELEGYCANPSSISSGVSRFKEISSLAASWAAGAPAPSPELEAAVNIRHASNDLREYASRSSDGRLVSASRHLAAAKNALAGHQGEGQLTDGIRDRMKGLEQAQREHLQELEEAY